MLRFFGNIERVEAKLKKLTDALLYPFFSFLSWAGMTPNTITHIRFLLGIFSFVALTGGRHTLGAGLLALTLFLDALDGGLARHTKQMSHRGTFIDRVCDYSIYVLTVMAMGLIGEIGSENGAYHIYIVFCAVILAIIAKNEGKRTDWIINPKANLVWFMLAWYCALFLFAFFDMHYLDETIFWLNILLTFSAIQSYTIIYHRWFGAKAKKRRW